MKINSKKKKKKVQGPEKKGLMYNPFEINMAIKKRQLELFGAFFACLLSFFIRWSALTPYFPFPALGWN